MPGARRRSAPRAAGVALGGAGGGVTALLSRDAGVDARGRGALAAAQDARAGPVGARPGDTGAHPHEGGARRAASCGRGERARREEASARDGSARATRRRGEEERRGEDDRGGGEERGGEEEEGGGRGGVSELGGSAVPRPRPGRPGHAEARLHERRPPNRKIEVIV